MKLRDLLKVIDGDVAITVKRVDGAGFRYTRLYWSYDSKLLLEQRSNKVLNMIVLDVASCLNENGEPLVAILIKENIK